MISEKLEKSKNWLVNNSLYLIASLGALYLGKKTIDFALSKYDRKQYLKIIKNFLIEELSKNQEPIYVKKTDMDLKLILKSYGYVVNDMRQINKGIEESIISSINNENRYKNTRNVNTSYFSNYLNLKEEEEKSEFLVYDIKQVEHYYYYYYILLNKLYSNDLSEYSRKRIILLKKYQDSIQGLNNKEIVKNKELLEYFSYIENFNNNFKEKEDCLLKDLFIILNKDFNFFKTKKIKATNEKQKEYNARYSEIDVNIITSKFYLSSNIELPDDLNYEKINEVVVYLFKQTKRNIGIAKKFYKSSTILDDDVYGIAECMAFDDAFQQYGYNEETIRVAMAKYDLRFEIIEGVENVISSIKLAVEN